MLNVGLTLTNRSKVARTVAKSGVGAHLADLNIIGPFVIPLAASLSPGQTVSVPNYLSLPFPQAPKGTFSSLGVMIMDSADLPLGGGGCAIEVQ